MSHAGHARLLQAVGVVRATGRTLKADALALEWQAIDAVKADTEPAIRRAFAELMEMQRAAVLSALPASVDTSAKRDRDPEAVRLGTALLDLGEWSAWIARTFGPVLARVLETGWLTGATRLGMDLPFVVTPGAEQAIREGVSLITNTTAETQGMVGRIVRDGLDAGDDVSAIAQSLGRAFDDWTDARAKMVARTESTRAFEAGQVEGFTEAGVESKRWLTERDERVRAEHDALDGEEVPVGSAFSNGLQYPSDPNCRCTLLPVTEAKAAPVKTWAQQRNVHIRSRYRALKNLGSQGIRAQAVYEEGYQGEPYSISVETLARIAKGRKR